MTAPAAAAPSTRQAGNPARYGDVAGNHVSSISIAPPNLTPTAQQANALPAPDLPLPLAGLGQSSSDITLRARSPRQGGHVSEETIQSSDEDEDDDVVIDDEEEVGASDSEEAQTSKAASGSNSSSAKPAQFNPATFAGIKILKAADITVDPLALGSGAFGNVYRGSWGKEAVALKQIDFEAAGQRLGLTEDELNEALQWEVARLATVNHPNLVQFHGVCHKDGQIYLVMEFCSKGNLQSVLRKERVPDSRLWQWMLEIAEGLAYLHGQGILHRDLKAENILIDQHGRAKLADLGVAQVDALLQENEAQATNKGFQDKRYVAPENVGTADGRERMSSKATDIYALGLVFWEMVSGGAEPDSWEDLHLVDPTFKDVKAGFRMPVPQDCPPPIRELMLSCWQREPAMRAGIGEIVQALRDMASALHPDGALLLLAEHLEHTLHARRADARNYLPSSITRSKIEGPVERYWQALEESTSSTTTTSPTALAATTTTTTTTTTSTTTTMSGAGPEKSKSTKGMQANPPLPLQEEFDAFLAQPKAGSLLLLGEGGLGKSLSMHVQAERLQQQWWQYFADIVHVTKPNYVPFFVRPHLKSWSHAELKNACADILQHHGFKSDQARLLVFVDGYDECQVEETQANKPKQDNPDEEGGTGKPQAPNLPQQLGLPADAKLVITCRPDTVPEKQLESRFAWQGRLQVGHYLAFSTNQLLGYLQQHLSWDQDTYAQTLARLQQASEPIGVLLKAQGKHDEALEYHRKALAIREKVLGVEHTDTAQSYNNIGLLLTAQGKHDEALEYHRKSLAIQEKVRGIEHTDTALSYNNFGWLLMAQGKHDEALEYYRKALAIKEKVLGTDHAGTAATYNGMGSALQNLGRISEALAYQNKALAIRIKKLGPDHLQTGLVFRNLGETLHAAGRYEEALDHHLKALRIRNKVSRSSANIDAAHLHANIGQTLREQGKLSEALEHARNALAMAQELKHPDSAKYQGQVDALLALSANAASHASNQSSKPAEQGATMDS